MLINRKTDRISTDSLTDEYRTPKMFFVGHQFDRCEHCNTKYSEKLRWLGITYYHRYSMVLCDRCIDKLNSVHTGQHIDYYWTDRDAEKDGLTVFPRKNLPKYNHQNQVEEDKYTKEMIGL
jgi:hypothetical protein